MLPKPAEMKEKVGNLSQILTTFHSIWWMPIEQTQPLYVTFLTFIWSHSFWFAFMGRYLSQMISFHNVSVPGRR